LIEPIRDVAWALRHLWRLVAVRRDEVVIYTYTPKQGEGKEDDRIRIFDRPADVPPALRADFARSRGSLTWWLARYRLGRSDARLLFLLEDGRMSAYGWYQRWNPLPRRYRWLAPRGAILGYFWTARAMRGRGLYQCLLHHCVAISKDRTEMPLIVIAETVNRSSQRGLEKAGFVRLGEYEVRSLLFGLIARHRTLRQERTIAQALAGS
jgi:RimJ/RimL family protein N-acetyltransferase